MTDQTIKFKGHSSASFQNPWTPLQRPTPKPFPVFPLDWLSCHGELNRALHCQGRDHFLGLFCAQTLCCCCYQLLEPSSSLFLAQKISFTVLADSLGFSAQLFGIDDFLERVVWLPCSPASLGVSHCHFNLAANSWKSE